MPQCRCGSFAIRPNHIPEDTIKHVIHAGHAGHRAGVHVAMPGALALAGAMKLVNKCRKAWHCNRCGENFND